MKYYRFLSFIICVLFISSCDTKKSTDKKNTLSKDLLEEMVFELLKESSNSGFPTEESLKIEYVNSLIKSYFFKPEELILHMDGDNAAIYQSKLDFFDEHSNNNNGSRIFLYWDDDILKQENLEWIYDSKQCDNTLLMTYINYRGHLEYLSICFKNSKVYSILPFKEENGKILWSRHYKETITEDGRILLIPSEIDSVME